ncbi:hypothetical protein [Streptomyces sp. NPDC055243]|uniref:hypothetical protein n=1 Tax=Streptomyces sp. NPDC055243 TaxID=3365720 RepID=UPI0037D53028
MASSTEWQLENGSAREFLAGEELRRPFIVVADEVPTDLAAFEAAVDHASYSFLAEVHARGYDLILVGFDAKAVKLSDQAKTIVNAVYRARADRHGQESLIVGGVGRGALAARYALARQERDSVDHETSVFFSYNGTAASPEEDEELKRLGDRAQRPMNLKAVSGDFASAPDDEHFDDTRAGDANTGGPLITKELGSWLLGRLG